MTGGVEYSALLQEDEDVCTLDCGCRLDREPNEGFGGEVAITFCGLHERAERLERAARNLVLLPGHGPYVLELRQVLQDIDDASAQVSA